MNLNPIINAPCRDYWTKTEEQQNEKLNEIALPFRLASKLMKVVIKDLFQ